MARPDRLDETNAKFFYHLRKILTTVGNIFPFILSVLKQNIAECLNTFLKKIEKVGVSIGFKHCKCYDDGRK